MREFDSIYNLEVQRILLSHLISDPDVFVRCRSIVKDEYFDDQLARAVRFIMAHADEYSHVPEIPIIKAKTGVDIISLSDYGIPMNHDWFFQEIERFCRYKALENVILDGYEMLQKGEDANIEARVKEAMTISLMSDLGTQYFNDPKSRLERLLDKSAMVPTGWATFDAKLFGGFTRGGLNLFCGGPGSGKSLILQNLALNWAMMGRNVVYFTFELSEDLVSLRLDSMLTGKSTKDVFRSIEDTSFMVSMKGKGAGSLYVKKLPEGGTNCNDLRAYLKEFQIKTGLKPDCIIVDYLDLMYPNGKIDMSNMFVKDKFVSEELRGLMHEMNAFGASASQLNRQSVEAQGEFDHSHIAGGISKLNTADNAVAIHAPSFMKEKGEIEFTFLKTRSSSAVGQKMKMRYDPVSMRITDLLLSEEIETEKPTSVDDLKKVYQTPQQKEVEVRQDTPGQDVDMMEKDPLTRLARLMVKSRS